MSNKETTSFIQEVCNSFMCSALPENISVINNNHKTAVWSKPWGALWCFVSHLFIRENATIDRTWRTTNIYQGRKSVLCWILMCWQMNHIFIVITIWTRDIHIVKDCLECIVKQKIVLFTRTMHSLSACEHLTDQMEPLIQWRCIHTNQMKPPAS